MELHSKDISKTEVESLRNKMEKKVEALNPSKSMPPKDWILVGIFEFKYQMLQHLPSEHWALDTRTASSEGDEIYYRCRFTKKRGQQCQAARLVVEPATTSDFHLYKTRAEHNHEDHAVLKNAASQKTRPEVEKAMRDIFTKDDKVTPSGIVRELELLNLKVPTKFIIRNRLQTMRHEKGQ